MKLYRCVTPTDRLCPCGKVARELKSAGIEFETQRMRVSRKPEKRPEIMALTGQPFVPVLVDDDGTGHPRLRPDRRAGQGGLGQAATDVIARSAAVSSDAAAPPPREASSRSAIASSALRRRSRSRRLT